MAGHALLVIDVQNEYETGALRITYPAFADSLANIGRAMDAATAAGVLVVLVQQDMAEDAPAFVVGSDGWQLHPSVGSRAHDHHVRKLLPGAFTGTGLEQWLRDHDVETVTVVGYMTQHCIDSTARQAMHAGFVTQVLSDATGTLAYANAVGSLTAQELHTGQLVALHAGIASVATTDEWLASLESGDVLPTSNPVVSAAAALAGAR